MSSNQAGARPQHWLPGLPGLPPPPGPPTATTLHLIVQQAVQPHFPGGWGDLEKVGIGTTNPIGQRVIIPVFSCHPEGLSTWEQDRERPGSAATSSMTGLAERPTGWPQGPDFSAPRNLSPPSPQGSSLCGHGCRVWVSSPSTHLEVFWSGHPSLFWGNDPNHSGLTGVGCYPGSSPCPGPAPGPALLEFLERRPKRVGVKVSGCSLRVGGGGCC